MNNNCITTYTGRHIDPLHPDPDMICIEDIAHALSLICRGNGQVKTFFSVGQHCINCAREALPFCNQDNTRVVDSRPVEDTNSIRRRRLCDACGRRFTTYEKVESIPLTVIKKDQNREQYNRSKIQSGILRACYKRPISIDKIEEMMDAIEGEIFNTEEKEISSTRIGEIVMEHLKDLDAVAYVRFASVYREFKDVSTFMDELKKFMN